MTIATIRDVAAQARVSIKTVSRVINNVKTVKPHTRERVLRVIRKLDYHPSPSARGLSGSRSYLIGLLYDVSCAYYATGVLGGVLETCRAAHYQVVMQPCDYKSASLTEEVSRNLRQSRADGVIVTPPLSDMKTLKALLEEQNVPFVRIAPAEHADDRRSVYTNDRESCAKMTEQLAGLGHTRIGFIIGNPDHAAVADRFQGYRDGLRKCGRRARQEADRAGLQLVRLGRRVRAQAAAGAGREAADCDFREQRRDGRGRARRGARPGAGDPRRSVGGRLRRRAAREPGVARAHHDPPADSRDGGAGRGTAAAPVARRALRPLRDVVGSRRSCSGNRTARRAIGV